MSCLWNTELGFWKNALIHLLWPYSSNPVSRPQALRLWNFLKFRNFIGLILWFSLEKMKSCFWKLELGFWTYGFILLLNPRRKIIYRPLLIDFFHKLISVRDVWYNMLHLEYSSTAAVILSSCTGELSPTNNKDAELNRQFHSALI